MEYNGIEYTKKKAWIQTRSGVKFHLLHPHPADFRITDIAYGLSNVCRFAGHTSSFYSVAEHSVRVSDLIREWKFSEEEQYAGLMHDAAEAYLSDIASPLKYLPDLAMYRDIEHNLEAQIAGSLKVRYPYPWCVKPADQVLLVSEARDLMSPVVDDWTKKLLVRPLDHKIRPWSPAKARRKFMNAYYRLNPFGDVNPHPLARLGFHY